MNSPEQVPNYSTPERLVEALGHLPPIAQVLARLQRLLGDMNSTLDDVAALIRIDAALTTRVIAISNSAWFGRGGVCRTIEDAVGRVGFREVFHLVAVTASESFAAQPLAAYGRDAMGMWRESVSCAFAAEMIAEHCGEDPAAAYMSGLLHGIGRLAINKYLVAEGEPLKRLKDEGFPGDHSGAELARFGFTQAQVGAVMLEKWWFTADDIEPIRHQYEPLTTEVPHDRMAAVLYGARFLRTTVCHAEPPAEIAGFDEVMQTLRLGREDLLVYVPALEDQVARAAKMLRA